ncbi:MAG TPA: HAMP domain-containing histidine kinase [Deltaproteobacteria bacterium]|nr:HAMP domain-containing histidine kinase [Deltaproteobacteria bacterium]
MSRLRTIALVGALLATVVLGATGWLVVRALAGVTERQIAQHRAIAEDLFDELEGELSDLVEREERRSFLEYRNVYVPGNSTYGGTAGLVLSPLASPPQDPSIVGYFQLDQGGGCSTPAIPSDNERIAAASAGWSPSRELSALQDELQRILSRVGDWGGPPPGQELARDRADEVQPQPPADEPPAQAPQVQLKRGALKRGNRTSQAIQLNPLNAEQFNNYQEDVREQLWSNQAPARPGVSAPWAETVDGLISPMSGLAVGEHLVLHREVSIGSVEVRQGLVLDLQALADRLEGVVLDGSELRPHVILAWQDELVPPAAYTFFHRFAPPFGALSVTAALQPIPGATSREAVALGALAALVVGVIVVGGLGLFRAVRAEVELARRRTDFAAAVTHELKTPLTTIRMYAEMLRDGLVPGEERQQEYHDTIVTESERLSRLVGNVLELSRLERGSPSPHPEILEVDAILHGVQELVAPLLRGAGARLQLQLQPGLPSIEADADGLVQALVNLIDNAIKFSSSASDRRISLDAFEGEGGVVIRVRDRGPGVPRAQLRKIFEPFYRGERELTRRTRGTGIGLALVQGVITRAGGRVWAHNVSDGGLEVLLWLPPPGGGES